VPGRKPSEVSEGGLDGKASEASEAPEAAEASGAGPDGKLSKTGVPLTPGTQTGVTNVGNKKGAKCAMAQSRGEEVPKEGKLFFKDMKTFPMAKEVPHLPYIQDTLPEGIDAVGWTGKQWVRTRIPFGLKKIEAAKWLARSSMGMAADRSQEELREFQNQRARHKMIVSMKLEILETAETCPVNTLLNKGCMTMCMDRDYTKAQGFEMKALNSAIIARNAVKQCTSYMTRNS
jgi:hypothetical protein